MTSASRKPQTPDAPVDAQLDDDALSAIRSMVAEQPEDAATQHTPQASRDASAPELAAPAAPTRKRKANNLPPLADPGADDPAPQPRHEATARGSMFARRGPRSATGGLGAKARAVFDGYRFRPLHAVLAVFALLVLFRPWLVLGLAFLSMFIVTGIFLMVGYDGFWRGVIRISRWYARRNPARAEIIHQRLDGFAMRWDAVLDRFPEGTVDGLYLPDFGELETADARHDEAMERRLASLRENKA